ncbi:hypothetical protein EVAR_414_1 [Eumeta japonica]|uniref:Uncharacterized protein n=1 Tax=Eumeta variegata TaxID=151549 RepID=A0A4C1SCE1_EUMVA|nr:hypothetical protein EVAR_414_1 [Eumeta japonica]
MCSREPAGAPDKVMTSRALVIVLNQDSLTGSAERAKTGLAGFSNSEQEDSRLNSREFFFNKLKILIDKMHSFNCGLGITFLPTIGRYTGMGCFECLGLCWRQLNRDQGGHYTTAPIKGQMNTKTAAAHALARFGLQGAAARGCGTS